MRSCKQNTFGYKNKYAELQFPTTSKCIGKGSWSKTLWSASDVKTMIHYVWVSTWNLRFAVASFALKPIQSQKQPCTSFPASSIIYCHKQTARICQIAFGARRDPDNARIKTACLNLSPRTTRLGAKEKVVSWVQTRRHPPVSLIYSFPSCSILSSITPACEGLWEGVRERRLTLIKFSRHHWQACCSSNRAINSVLPITVPPPPSFPRVLLLAPYAIHHSLSWKGGGRQQIKKEVDSLWWKKSIRNGRLGVCVCVCWDGFT